MIYNFSQRKNQNERVEEGLRSLKEEFCTKEMSEEQLQRLRQSMEETLKMEKRQKRKKRCIRAAAVAAAAAAIFVILPNTSAAVAHAMEEMPVIGGMVKVVTFRSYTYESQDNMLFVQVPQLQTQDQSWERGPKEELERTTEEINQEIRKISKDLVEEFEAGLQNQEGHQDMVVDSQVLAAAQDYFTLKLICYQSAGSGYERNYFYTIDLKTGKRLSLGDLFQEGTDYLTVISQSIKEQMGAQMEGDENVMYWLDSDMEEWNFKGITDETSFYLNEKGNVVISFNEGDVAPMYMGVVEFEIPQDVLQGIRK